VFAVGGAKESGEILSGGHEGHKKGIKEDLSSRD
jgi:hypothetical protein